jgi:hypothetical protein
VIWTAWKASAGIGCSTSIPDSSAEPGPPASLGLGIELSGMLVVLADAVEGEDGVGDVELVAVGEADFDPVGDADFDAVGCADLDGAE